METPNLDQIIRQADEYDLQLPELPTLPPAPQGAAIARCIDHTLLKPEATPAQVEQLCLEALTHSFAAVCVNSLFTGLVAQILQGSSVATCSVVGFPLGASGSATKVFETAACLEAGAQEIDMVISVGLLKSEGYAQVLADIQAVVQTAHAGKAGVKVIIETALLTRREKILACLLSQMAGADFVKTSTGFSSSGATVEDIDLMRRMVGSQMGVKASGGVRSYQDALAMIQAGASRIGTSAGVKIVQESQSRAQA